MTDLVSSFRAPFPQTTCRRWSKLQQSPNKATGATASKGSQTRGHEFTIFAQPNKAEGPSGNTKECLPSTTTAASCLQPRFRPRARHRNRPRLPVDKQQYVIAESPPSVFYFFAGSLSADPGPSPEAKAGGTRAEADPSLQRGGPATRFFVMLSQRRRRVQHAQHVCIAFPYVPQATSSITHSQCPFRPPQF